MSMVGRINMPFVLESQAVGEGTVTGDWQEVGSFWGQLRAVPPSDGSTHQLIMRYNAALDIKPGQRAVYDGKHYLIHIVHDPYASKQWLTLHVKEEKYLN